LEIRALNEALNTAMHRIMLLETRVSQLETITNQNTFKWQPHTTLDTIQYGAPGEFSGMNYPVYPVWQPATPEYFVTKPDPNKYYTGTPPQTFSSVSSGTILVADSEGGVHWEHCEPLVSGSITTSEPVWNPE
jgi:hypothetical protein